MLTLVIPIRDWPAERLEACIQSYLALKSEVLSEILVVDFGSVAPIRIKQKHAHVKLLRVEADVWSLAEAINVGVLAASNKVFAKTDADILISPKSTAGFDNSARRVASGEIGLAVTQATDLGSELSLKEAADLVAGGSVPGGRLRPKWGQGGLVFFSQQGWARLGGFESRFTGWGNEDNDFQERMRNAGERVHWVDRAELRIFHVWHPPSYARTGIAKQRSKNEELSRQDRSIFRQTKFIHSNAKEVLKPAVWTRVSPLVTLAIASTGRPGRTRMVREALYAFKGQIENAFEAVVVDNGSTDEDYQQLQKSLQAIKWLDQVRLERLATGSIPAARNAITQVARGRYICVVDDDDIALPNRLQDHLKVFEKDGRLHGSHGGWIDFDEDTGLIERNQGKDRTLATMLMGTGKITAHPASLFRRDVLRAVPYDEAFALGSDLDLALRMAALGLDIAHTRSFLTLRRFHSSNVTVTGLSNQVSNGMAARGRMTVMLGVDNQQHLAAQAKERDAEVYCANTMSLDNILQRLPAYVGSWRILIPVAALEGPPAKPIRGKGSASLLEQLHSIVQGEFCTRKSGPNRPVYFRSEAIKGLSKAKNIRERIEIFLGQPVELLSDRQCEIDRKVGYDWRGLSVEQGKRLLRSAEIASCTDALVARARLNEVEALGNMTSLISDWDGQREIYFLLTDQIKGFDEIRRLHHKLEELTGLAFVQLAGGGIPSDLTMGGKSH